MQLRQPPFLKVGQAGWIVAAVVVIACVAISGRSLWSDEACTALKAALPPTLGGWWRALAQDRTSEVQMPLYMFYVWGWAKLFGYSEWSLHAANLPWFVAGAAAFILAFPPGDRRRLIAACVALLCPFAWYYLDEARPYAMQLGASLLVVASLARLGRSQSLAERCDGVQVALFLFGVVALSGSSLLGMIWVAAALAAMPALVPGTRIVSLVGRYWYWCIAAGGLLLLFAGYYLWTLTVGARASAVATTTVGSVLFVGYELLGFGGLGPGRLDLRSVGTAALRPHLAWLALYAIPTSILIGAALLQLIRGGNRRHLAVALCCTVPPAFILGVGWVVHFRVLGRHLTPFVPVLMLVFTCGLAGLWERGSVWGRGVALLFCILSLVSCLSLRFSPRHERDNYRAAAALAKAALLKGQFVWWNAAPQGAVYYDLPINTRPGSSNEAVLVWNPTRETLLGLPPPQIIVASKPDIYDAQRAVAAYVREHGFQPEGSFAAFVIWRRGGN